MTSDGACGPPFASDPWQPEQVPAGRAAADVDRLLVAIGRCWRRRESAPRAGVRYVGRQRHPLINKPRDLRFGAQFQTVRARRVASTISSASLTPTGFLVLFQFVERNKVCSLHTRHRERRKRVGSVDLRRRQVWMLDSCAASTFFLVTWFSPLFGVKALSVLRGWVQAKNARRT